jgi:hypothetical protein
LKEEENEDSKNNVCIQKNEVIGHDGRPSVFLDGCWRGEQCNYRNVTFPKRLILPSVILLALKLVFLLR